MPMRFTVEMVLERLRQAGLSLDGTERQLRDRLAQHVEEKHGDVVEAHEIRTGKPWDEWNEIEQLAMLAHKMWRSRA